MKQANLNLLDVTIKEGGFRINHSFLPDQVTDIAREVERSGLSTMEVSHGCGVGSFKRGFPGLHSDKVYLKAAHQGGPQLDYSVYLSGSEGSESELEPIKDLFQIGRVGISVHEVEKIGPHLKKLKDLGKTAVGVLQRIQYRSPEQCGESARKMADLGADIVYLVDTFGSLDPNEVAKHIEVSAKESSLPVGFQGRNHSGQALENSLAAIEAGATWIDVSLGGMGRGGGITSMEALSLRLQKMNLGNDLDLLEMTRAFKNYVLPSIRSLPVPNYTDLMLSKHQMDFYPEVLLERIANILDLSVDDFLGQLKASDPDLVQLKETHLRDFLANEKLDLDVVIEFIKTGQVPQNQ